MSSSNSPDPRLLLPDWLRDGDLPAVAVVERQPSSAAEPLLVAVAEVAAVENGQQMPGPATPFSDRLSLDTRLDPAQLVAVSDLPTWLGGLEHQPFTATARAMQGVPAPSSPANDEPAFYDELDAPQGAVIDVQINGWYIMAGALGLLILLAAALRLYLS